MMQIKLHDSSEILDIDFGVWLTNLVRVKLISNISKYNFDSWNTYLEQFHPKTISKNYTENVLIFAAQNLKCDAIRGTISIKFNPNIFVPGFDRLKLKDILKSINYGTLNIKGCPVVTNTFKYFEDNIDNYISSYYNI